MYNEKILDTLESTTLYPVVINNRTFNRTFFFFFLQTGIALYAFLFDNSDDVALFGETHVFTAAFSGSEIRAIRAKTVEQIARIILDREDV